MPETTPDTLTANRPDAAPRLSLDAICKRFGDHVAVADMTLDVRKGEFVSLLGPSGCGKTTTLQMIAGFLAPSSGSIRLDGRDLAAVRPAKRGLGIVFQSYALFPHMTAAENVGFGLDMRGVARAERDKRVLDALALVGLAGFENRHPRRLSGGQQQRVALARALVIRPELLLLDEPLSNLDAKMREDMQIELRQIQRNLGTTTVLVTHDQGEAMALSDRVVVMNKGRVEQIATPQTAYDRPASAFVARFLGKTNEFAGAARDGRVRVGGLDFAAAETSGRFAREGSDGPLVVVVRPERLAFADPGAPGLPGRVLARIFQGDHWLYQIDTDAGPAILIRQNDGAATPGEGEAVAIAWRAQDATLRASGAT